MDEEEAELEALGGLSGLDGERLRRWLETVRKDPAMDAQGRRDAEYAATVRKDPAMDEQLQERLALEERDRAARRRR
jgi:hypothetical protein